MNQKHIFAFWEPRENLPAYLELCMKTWKKFLPEYEIHLLDYKSIIQWLSPSEIKQFQCPSRCSLAMQADIYRALLLSKHGGLWLDCDTIITSRKAADFLDSTPTDFSLFGTPDRRITHAACLYAKKPHLSIIEEWVNELNETMPLIRMRYGNRFYYIIYRILNILKIVKKIYWGSAFNAIMDKLVYKSDENEVTVWSREDPKYGVFPELRTSYTFADQSVIDNYVKFWFSECSSTNDFMNESGIIMLHNGWTPSKYRKMKEEEFLSQNIRLSLFIKNLLSLDS
ncbi:MAG: hypothetical protein IJB31_04085 [Akkermansia sp.]|nr:hypothetical protein [Akkermansia sp.]